MILSGLVVLMVVAGLVDDPEANNENDLSFLPWPLASSSWSIPFLRGSSSSNNSHKLSFVDTVLPVWDERDMDKARKHFGMHAPTGMMCSKQTASCQQSRDCALIFPAADLRDLVEQEESLLPLNPTDAALAAMSANEVPLPLDTVQYPSVRFVPTIQRIPLTTKADGASTATTTTTTTTTAITAASSNSHIASLLRSTAVLTRTGYKGGDVNDQKNQDRIMVMKPYRANGVEYPVLMALFDGHGNLGHVVAHHAVLSLPMILERQLDEHSDTSIKTALTETFREIERTLPKSVAASGSTGIVMLQTKDDKLYVANTGDSFAVVATIRPGDNDRNKLGNSDAKNHKNEQKNKNKKDGTKKHEQPNPTSASAILYETTAHKPDMPKERQRVEAAGGIVYIPPADQGAASSRVVVPVGQMQLALAMSRSIGDAEATAVGVTADPTIDMIDLRKTRKAVGQDNIMAILATDGVWDRIDHKEVASHLGKALVSQGQNPSTSSSSTTSTSSSSRLLGACEEIVMASAELWYKMGITYRDDISIAVTTL